MKKQFIQLQDDVFVDVYCIESMKIKFMPLPLEDMKDLIFLHPLDISTMEDWTPMYLIIYITKNGVSYVEKYDTKEKALQRIEKVALESIK